MSSRANSMSEPVVVNTPARIESSMPYRILIVVGLAVGAVLGLGGNFIHVGPAQNVVYTISSLGIIMGSALLAAWFARQGRDTVAVGFALLALAESISLSGIFLLASVPTFPGAYTFACRLALYAVALPLVSVTTRVSALDSHYRDARGNPVCDFSPSHRGLDDHGPAGHAIVTALAFLRP